MGERSDHESEESSEAGLVDESLIDAMLALGPEERLRQNDRMLRTIRLLQQGVAASSSRVDGEGR
jgi:hypothetical protein